MKKYYVIISALLIWAFVMIGCAQENQNPTTVEETVVDTMEADAAETVENNETVIAVEKTTEETESEEESYYIPEGVDLESNLSGEEWIKSFIGVVNEPVVVIYNDVTGRKDIVHDGDKIHVNPDEDWMGMYYPNGIIREDENGEFVYHGISGYVGTCYPTESEDGVYGYELYEADAIKMRDYGIVEASAINGNWRIEFRIIVD